MAGPVAMLLRVVGQVGNTAAWAGRRASEANARGAMKFLVVAALTICILRLVPA